MNDKTAMKPDLKKLIMPITWPFGVPTNTGVNLGIRAIRQQDFDAYRNDIITNIEKLKASAVEVFACKGHTGKACGLWSNDNHTDAHNTHRTWIFPDLTEEIEPARVTKDEILRALRQATGILPDRSLCPSELRTVKEIRELADRIEGLGIEP